MKITGYDLIWIAFWVSLFSYWGFKAYLAQELKKQQIKRDIEIAKIHAESRDKFTESLDNLNSSILNNP